MKTFKEFKKNITEGTWALPDTPQKKKELKKLLSKPLPADKATKALYHLLGDDGLHDMIDQIEKEDGKKADVRSTVSTFIKQNNIRL